MSIIRIPPPEAETETAPILHPDSARLRYLPTQAPKAEGRHLDWVDCLLRRWVLALFLLLAVGVFGSAWTMRHVQPSYQAEAMVYISPDLARDRGGDVTESGYRTLVTQQILTILHNDTLRSALHWLATKSVPTVNKGQSEAQALAQLRDSLEIHAVPDSYEVSIQSTNTNPNTAAATANAVAQSYVLLENQLGNAGSGSTTMALNEEKESLEKRLWDELELRGRLAASLEVINPGEGSVLPQDEVLRRIREALVAVHTQRLEAEANLAKGVLPTTNQSDINSSPSEMSRTALLRRQAELRERVKGMLPAHPVRKQVEAELADTDAELRKIPAGAANSLAASSLHAQVEADRQIEESLSQDLADQTSSIPLQAKSMQEVQLVNAVILRIQGQLSQVEERLEDIQLRNIAGAIRIFSPADAPDKPLKNQKTKILIAIWVAAVMLSIGVPIAFDLADDHLYYSADVERTLGAPLIGVTIRRSPELDKFADEQLARVAGSLARAITGEFGVRTLFVSNLKHQTSPAMLENLATKLFHFGIEARINSATPLIESPRFAPAEDLDFTVLDKHQIVLINGPAFLFSAEAERLASESDLTLLVIEAGSDTRTDLIHCVQVLQRLNVPNLKVMLSDVEVERGGRALKSQVKEYLSAQTRFS